MEGLAVSARLLEVILVLVAPIVSEFFGKTLSFEQCMQLEKERAKIENERLQI